MQKHSQPRKDDAFRPGHVALDPGREGHPIRRPTELSRGTSTAGLNSGLVEMCPGNPGRFSMTWNRARALMEKS